MTPSSPSPALPQRLEDGTVVGRYVIDGWLRDGGMASLYRGHHARTGAKVAIKIQLGHGAADHVTAARFDREGQVMGRLSGAPSVVQVHDVGELSDGRRYLAMEWIEGDNLEELLDDLRNADRMLGIERTCRIMKDVALALAAVHRAEVVHRDLKPSNIMIDRGHPDREAAKLLDFGISADLGAGAGSGDLTATGIVLGTSGYVAPEQALGLPAHPSFDLYAFGVVLFEALTGYGAPPEGLVAERLPSITTLRGSVPPELAELVADCLQRDPSRRPPTAEALVERLDAVLLGLSRSGRTQTRSPAQTSESGSGARASGEPEPPRTASEPTVAREPMQAPGTSWRIGAVVVGALAVLGLALVAARCGVLEGLEARDAATHTETDTRDPPTADPPVGLPAANATTSEVPAETTTGRPDPVSERATGSSSTSSAIDSSSTDETEPDDGPKDPPRTSTSAACVELRRRTYDAATRQRDWKAVLRATSDRRCWTTAAHRNERKALRVEALLELGRFAECVEEGTGSTDPRIAKATKLCRVRVEKESR